jgi:UDP-2,3-diacylglucosamine pyrophosphatase LpxH
LQKILLKPILWASEKFASDPNRKKIFEALSQLRQHISDFDGKKGITLELQPQDKFIIFSDQHRGAKNGADDFMNAEPNYLAALDFYYKEGFSFISLGDSEELWENSLSSVKKYNTVTFETEKRFIKEKRFYKVFGNHDLLWANDPLSWLYLKNIYGEKVKVYEGMILQLAVSNLQLTTDKKQSAITNLKLPTANCQLQIFLTHGHQGDANSDGNWFTKFFVARIWAPSQAFLKINPNTPAYNDELKTEHNRIMYEWSAQQKNTLLITGHTHQPVFKSLTHSERLYKELLEARSASNSQKIQDLETKIHALNKKKNKFSNDVLSMKPTYFNSGCCCFNDGDITGIEITNETISLIKWDNEKGREILETTSFNELITQIK